MGIVGKEHEVIEQVDGPVAPVGGGAEHDVGFVPALAVAGRARAEHLLLHRDEVRLEGLAAVVRVRVEHAAGDRARVERSVPASNSRRCSVVDAVPPADVGTDAQIILLVECGAEREIRLCDEALILLKVAAEEVGGREVTADVDGEPLGLGVGGLQRFCIIRRARSSVRE